MSRVRLVLLYMASFWCDIPILITGDFTNTQLHKVHKVPKKSGGNTWLDCPFFLIFNYFNQILTCDLKTYLATSFLSFSF